MDSRSVKMACFGVLSLSLLWAVSHVSQVVGDVGNQQTVLNDEQMRRVAIIGAGSAGSSAAYYINKYSAEFGIHPEITVFERSSYIGGRSTTINVHSNPLEPVEVGASIFVEANTNLFTAVKELNLETTAFMPKPQHDDDDKDSSTDRLGVWNGDSFVFTQDDSSSSWWNTVKILWKYGMAPIRTRNLRKSTVGKFVQMYEHPHFPFRSLSRVAFDLGLTAVTASTGEQYLTENGISAPFSTDIIQASTR
ncbi:MAG: hypothetical protein M4579_007561, partial [Chaenotheca gracillima]